MRHLRQQVVQPLDPSYRIIPLTRNQVTLVSTHRYEELNKFSWNAHWDKRGQRFYACREIKVDGKRTTIFMHKVISGTDSPHIDHENRNSLDNRDENLRQSTVSQNAANTPKYSNNKSGYKGVSVTRYGKYRAAICFQKQVIYLGTYFEVVDAARVYDRAAIKYFGDFAHTNFPHSDYL